MKFREALLLNKKRDIIPEENYRMTVEKKRGGVSGY
jgi:hypothetical protein